MGAADGRYVGRVRQNCQPRRDAGVVRHGCVQLPLDGALAGPAVHELDISRGVAVQEIGHGIAVDAPAPNDGDGVMGEVGTVPALEIAADQNADGRPCPGQGDQGALPSPALPDLLRRPGHSLRCDAGVPLQGVVIGGQIGRGGLILQGQHLRVVDTALDPGLPLPGAQGRHQAGDVFQQDGHILTLICAEHKILSNSAEIESGTAQLPQGRRQPGAGGPVHRRGRIRHHQSGVIGG